MMTHTMVHCGLATAVRENRQTALEVACCSSRTLRAAPANPPKEVSINKPKHSADDTHKIPCQSVSLKVVITLIRRISIVEMWAKGPVYADEHLVLIGCP